MATDIASAFCVPIAEISVRAAEALVLLVDSANEPRTDKLDPVPLAMASVNTASPSPPATSFVSAEVNSRLGGDGRGGSGCGRIALRIDAQSVEQGSQVVAICAPASN